MTKRKDAIALFDLISKGKTERAAGLSVPGWFSKRPAPAPAPDEPGAGSASPGDAGATTPSPAPEPGTFSAASAASPFSPSAPYEPIFTVADNRVKISLNYTACGVAAAGVALALLLVFFLGRVSVRSSGAGAAATGPDTSGGHETPYRPSATADPNVTAFTPVTRDKGKYYLVIDRMKGKTEEDRLDAIAIYDYCQKNGQKCMALMYGPDRFAVLSLKPFDNKTSLEAAAFARAIEDLGKKYKPPAGRAKYTFNQHSRPDKLDPSWYQEPAGG